MRGRWRSTPGSGTPRRTCTCGRCYALRRNRSGSSADPRWPEGRRPALTDVVEAERPEVERTLRERVSDPRARLGLADPLDGKERLQLLDLEVHRPVDHVLEGFEVGVRVHPAVEHVVRHGLVDLPAADERLEESERGGGIEVRGHGRDGLE